MVMPCNFLDKKTLLQTVIEERKNETTVVICALCDIICVIL